MLASSAQVSAWRTKIEESAVVAHAEIHGNVSIGANAFVGRIPDQHPTLARAPRSNLWPTVIEDGVSIGVGSVIFAGSKIGANTYIGDLAIIRESVEIGQDCIIGCHVSISYDARIGNRCRFQNGTVFIGSCGDDCVFGVGVVTSNDRRLYPMNYVFDPLTIAAPILGNRVLVGSGANLLAGVRIGDDAIIAAGAVVCEDVPAGARVFGPKAQLR